LTPQPDLLVLFVVGWTVAFLLGKELQQGFAQWWQGRD
jgi:hypothetical protein